MPYLPKIRPLTQHSYRLGQWLWERQRRWMVFLAISLAALSTFLEISDEMVEDEELSAVDAQILRWVASQRRPWLTIRAVDITALGSTTLLGLTMFAAVVPLLRLRDLRGSAQLAIAVFGGGLWTMLTKRYFSRARPEIVERLMEVQGFSFPSGHSAGSSALYVTLAIVLGRHIRTLNGRLLLLAGLSLLSLTIGLTRVYLGVHYPSDVLSGLVFGSGWALLLTALFEWHRGRLLGPPAEEQNGASTSK